MARLPDSETFNGPCGGVLKSTLINCLVYGNLAAPGTENYDSDSTFNYCCTMPLPTNGIGNITNAPLFVDLASGDLRLQPASPCINSGNNGYVTTATDPDGNSRVVSGTVDIGAYEYQGAGSVISYAWLQQSSLPTDGTADYADVDVDGFNNWQEWICGTCPNNAQSALRLLPNPARGESFRVDGPHVLRRMAFRQQLECTDAIAPDLLQQIKCAYGRCPKAALNPFADDPAVRQQVLEKLHYSLAIGFGVRAKRQR